MKRSTSSFAKTASNLYQSIHQPLSVYAVAAVVALVSVLALAPPSEAKIVYTPVNINIEPTQNYNLDLNHDGITDFTIKNGSGGVCRLSSVSEQPAYGNGVIGYTENRWAAALGQGAPIGHGQAFLEGVGVMAFTILLPHCEFALRGAWVDVTDRYLGLSFQRNSRTHYGWARLSVHWEGRQYQTVFAVTLTGYAYETIAGKSIKAGQTKEAAEEPTNEDFGSGASLTVPLPDNTQPASLGMLAFGAQGVPLWRRKRSALEADLKGAL